MRKFLISVVAAVSCLASFGAYSQESLTPYRFDLTWSGAGYYCYYRSLCQLVAIGGNLPITTLGETGSFSQSFGGFDFTIVTAPDSSDPTLADAVVYGTIDARSIDGGSVGGEFYFYADSSDPYAGYSREESGDLLGFAGGAEISQGAPIPEPAESVLILAGLSFVGMLFRRRKR